MSEKFKGIPEIINKVEPLFKVESVLNEKQDDVVEILTLLEGEIFDEQGVIKENVDRRYLINAFVDNVKKFFDFSNTILIQIDDVKRDSVLASALNKKQETTLTDVGFVESTTHKQAIDVVLELQSYVHGVLFELISQGEVSADDLGALGFDSSILIKMQKMIEFKQEKELELWIKDENENESLELKYPILKELRLLMEIGFENINDFDSTVLETFINAFEKAKADTKGVTEKLKTKYLKDEYFDSAKKYEEELKKYDNEFKNKEKIKTEINDFEKSIESLSLAIEDIPFLREELDFNDNSDEERYESQISALIEIKNKLYESRHLVDQVDDLQKRSDGVAKDKINTLIENLEKKYETTRKRVESLLLEAQEPPIEEMTIGDIAKEILKERKDPFFWKEWKASAGHSPRLQLIVNTFIEKAMGGGEKDSSKEINRIVQKLRVQLGTLDNELQHEHEKATRDRSRLFEEMAKRVITRRELLIATTYHPIWGEDVREMLDWSIKTAALRPGEATVMFNGKLTVVKNGGKSKNIIVERDGRAEAIDKNNKQADEIELDKKHVYIKKMDYYSLSGEKGSSNLDGGLKDRFSEVFSDPEKKQGFEFAKTLFITFDLLTISLGEMQKRTTTRSHNGGLGDVDRIMFGDPLSSSIHKALRYGGNKSEWALRSLMFFEPLENSHLKYGKIPEDEKEPRIDGFDTDHLRLVAQQKLMNLREKVMFGEAASNGESGFLGKIPIPGFCETIGINTMNFLELHGPENTAAFGGEGEKLWLFDKLVDHNGKKVEGSKINESLAGDVEKTTEDVIEEKKNKEKEPEENKTKEPAEEDENVVLVDLFAMTEEKGFAQLLELTFKRTGQVTEHSILRKHGDGQKAGLLGLWIQAAGRAKMFPGSHLRLFLQPLLTNFVLRLFQNFDQRDNEYLREALFEKVIEELRSSASGGLSAYKPQVVATINSLCKKPIFEAVPSKQNIDKNKKKGRDPNMYGKYAIKSITGNKMEQGKAIRPWENWRLSEREEYLEAWWRFENMGNAPPKNLWGFRTFLHKSVKELKREFWDGKNPEILNYLLMLKGDLPMPDSIDREGDMLQATEEEKH